MTSLIAFFSLTYIVSWICFAASAALSGGTFPASSGFTGIGGAVLLLGIFAPALVALALTARAEGRAGVKALLGQILKFPADARLYVFAIAYMASIKLAVALLHRLATGAWPVFGREPILIMALGILVSTPMQAGEEVGWRGFALPRLAARIGLARAGIVLGVIWAAWHLPFFFIPGGDTFGQSFFVYLLNVTAISVAMAWLYWRGGGSLFLTMLLHASVNNTKDIVPSAVSTAGHPFALRSSLVGWLTATLLCACAAYLLARMRPT